MKNNVTIGPIFTITKCKGMNNIPLPQWFKWRDGSFLGWDKKQAEQILSMTSSTDWSSKSSKAIFRGSIRPSTLIYNNSSMKLEFIPITKDTWTMFGRTKLYYLGQHYPDLLDVGLFGKGIVESKNLLDLVTNWQYRPPLTISQQSLQFKYVINVEGACGWADRLKTLLASDMLILMQETPCHEFFYPLIVPFYHYIPIKNDLSDLLDKIEWCRNHEDQVKEIISNAQEFALSVNNQSGWFYYFTRAMIKYSSLLTWKPKKRKDSQLFIRETSCPNLRNYKCDDDSSFKKT